jgi:hypothetical protein
MPNGLTIYNCSTKCDAGAFRAPQTVAMSTNIRFCTGRLLLAGTLFSYQDCSRKPRSLDCIERSGVFIEALALSLAPRYPPRSLEYFSAYSPWNEERMTFLTIAHESVRLNEY